MNRVLEKEGISSRYDESKNEYVYDRRDLANTGYDSLLKYLNDKNIDYEISKSTEAGYVPSIYVKDEDGNTILRIANHDNGYINDFDMVYNDAYNDIFDDRDYINWKDKIVPKLEKILQENNIQELDNSSFSNIIETSINEAIDYLGDDGKFDTERNTESLYNEIWEYVEKELNRDLTDNEYVSFVEKLKTLWEDAYYSNQSNLKDKTFYSKKVEKNYEIDYTNLNYEVIPYISADERKTKFLKYSRAESFYDLDYDTMDRAIAVGAKYAIEAQNKGLSNSYFIDDNYIYDFEIIDKSNNSFGITNVETIEDNVRSDVDERIAMENNGFFNDNSRNDTRNNDWNNQSIENGRTSDGNVGISSKGETNNILPFKRESKGNSKQELDNSSFFLNKNN